MDYCRFTIKLFIIGSLISIEAQPQSIVTDRQQFRGLSQFLKLRIAMKICDSPLFNAKDGDYSHCKDVVATDLDVAYKTNAQFRSNADAVMANITSCFASANINLFDSFSKQRNNCFDHFAR